MSDPNRPRRSPPGTQHRREQGERYEPQRDSRSTSRSGDSTRPPNENTRPPRDNSSRGEGPRTRDRGAGRDEDAPARSSSRTRSSRSGRERDEWDDPKWNKHRWDDDEPDPRRGRERASSRDRWDDEPERPTRRRGDSPSVGASRRDAGGPGPRGWDDNAWESDEWERAAWNENGWDEAGDRSRAPRGTARGAMSDDDAWLPGSRRGANGQSRQAAARRDGWKEATWEVAAAVKRPASLRELLRTNKRARVVAIVMLVVILFCMIPAPILAYSNTMGLAKDGVAQLKSAENDFQALGSSPTNLAIINDAQQHLQNSHNDFFQLQIRVTLLSPAGALPKVGSKVAGANKLLPLAVEGTQAGVLACDALKTLVGGLKNPLGTTGGLTSADMNQITSDVDQIQTLFGQMAPVLQNLTQADLALDPGLWPTVSGLQAKMPQVTQLVSDLDGLAHVLPQLLGVGKPSTYLVEVLDSSELRPTGGFIGNFGALTLNDGRLDSKFAIRDITLIDSSVKFPVGTGAGQVAVDHQPIQIPDQYSWLKTIFAAGSTDSWSVRDSNLDPNYPTTAKYALDLYNQLLPDAQTNLDAQGSTIKLYDPSKDGQFAGVVTLSLGFFAQALNVTGEIHVVDAKNPKINEYVNAQNFVAKIHEYALGSKATGYDSQTCGDTSCSKVFTSDVVKTFMATVKSNLSKYIGGLGKLFYVSLRTKDIEIYLTPPPAQLLLHDLKLSAEVAAPTTGDSVFEVDTNIGANKANGILKYQMSDQITLDSSGAASHQLNWAYTWPNDPNTIAEIFKADPNAANRYHSYSRIYTPPNSTLIANNGMYTFGSDTAFSRKVYHGTVYADYNPYYAQVSKYGLAWKVPNVVIHDSLGYHYHLIFQREAGIIWPLTLTVKLPACVTAAAAPITSGVTVQSPTTTPTPTTTPATPTTLVTEKGNVVTITGPLTQDQQFQFDWNC